jgi:hypothetical protein
MGETSKVISPFFRFFQLASATIVVGLLGQYLNYVASADDHANSRIVYTVALGGISMLASIIFFIPFKFSFWSFPLDYSLFVMWIVAFGLLCNLNPSRNCSSTWYWSSWGYYWGRWYRTVPVNAVTQSVVGSAGCSQWRTVLAFSFIGAWFWFASGLLGTYVITQSKDETPHSEMGTVPGEGKHSRWKRASHAGSEATNTTANTTDVNTAPASNYPVHT